MDSRKKKLYGLLIAVGAVALAVDRIFLSGGPAPAGAAGTVMSTGSKSVGVEPAASNAARPNASTAENAASTGNRLIPDIPFPRGVAPWDPDKPMRDLFRPPFQEVSNLGDGANSNSVRKARDLPGRDGFSDRHKLQLVLTKENFHVAVIDGAWLRVGDSVEGCVLREIRGAAAVFSCHNGDAALSATGDKSTNKP